MAYMEAKRLHARTFAFAAADCNRSTAFSQLRGTPLPLMYRFASSIGASGLPLAVDFRCDAAFGFAAVAFTDGEESFSWIGAGMVKLVRSSFSAAGALGVSAVAVFSLSVANGCFRAPDC